MRRRIRRLRQLIPTKFATVYRTVSPRDGIEPNTPMFCTWWMVWGKCYRVNHRAI
jgi:hypothetical protein